MLKARNGSFYDANPKGEFYGKVPITYFSDAFQDILTRYGFFLFYGSLKRKKKKIFDFMRSATNFHFRSVLVDILS